MSFVSIQSRRQRSRRQQRVVPQQDTAVVRPSTVSTVAAEGVVIDVSLIPWLRSIAVDFAGHSFRPQRQVYYFFDDTAIINFIQRPNILRLQSNTQFTADMGASDRVSASSNIGTVLLSVVNPDTGNTELHLSNTVGGFLSGSTITGSRSGATATVAEYIHLSGQAQAGGANSITLGSGASNVSSYYVGNTIYVTAGLGIGQSDTIASYNGISKIANTTGSWTTVPGSNSKYSIGDHYVNRDGSIAGTFIIPAYDDAQFHVGERIFRIIDDSQNIITNALTRGEFRWLGQGITEVKTDIIISTPQQPPQTPPPPAPTQPPPPPRPPQTPPEPRERPSRRRDPLAQTFYVDGSVYESGVFLSSVDIFFKQKHDILPVTLQIRPTVNGFPHSYEILKSAEVTLYPISVKTSTAPDVANSATATTFTFPAPVYLEPNKEYAIVIISDSEEYECFASELGQKIIGSDRIVSEQPYLGSLFKSQNATAWTPAQLEDLMFVLRKCVFSTSQATVDFYNQAPEANLFVDSYHVETDETLLPNTSLVYAISTDTGGSYANTITNQDYDLSTRATLLTSTDGISRLRATLVTTNQDVTPILYHERMNFIGVENIINNLPITNNKITITDYGTGYSTNANISLSITGGGGSGANAYVGNVQSGNIISIIVDNPGSGYTGQATLSFSGGTGGTPANAIIASETAPSGGLANTRYLTRKVTLADGFDAGDLRAFVTAYKPIGTDMYVYYKVKNSNDQDTFESKNWTLMVQKTASQVFSADSEDVIEYEFRPALTSNAIVYSTQSASYTTFNQFAIKIVLASQSTTLVPVAYDLRAIALPADSN